MALHGEVEEKITTTGGVVVRSFESDPIPGHFASVVLDMSRLSAADKKKVKSVRRITT